MRYFIAKNGSTVVDKQVVAGDDQKIDALVEQYKARNPALTVTELDAATFDATPFTPQLNSAQQAWATLKASGPTPMQVATFFARYLGLE